MPCRTVFLSSPDGPEPDCISLLLARHRAKNVRRMACGDHLEHTHVTGKLIKTVFSFG
jgi:hypothetical protein